MVPVNIANSLHLVNMGQHRKLVMSTWILTILHVWRIRGNITNHQLVVVVKLTNIAHMINMGPHHYLSMLTNIANMMLTVNMEQITACDVCEYCKYGAYGE